MMQNLSGLQSLMQATQAQMPQAQKVPEGLRALISAAEKLKQVSQPVVQTPIGPKQTVSAQVGQGLESLAEQQMPDINDVGDQANIAGQIMQQRLMQQQKMAQDPQAIAGMAAQMLQRNPAQVGIAQQAPQTQFKEGGIIGFDGTGPSQLVQDVMSLPEKYAEWYARNREEDKRKAEEEAVRAARRSAITEAQSGASFGNYLFGTPDRERAALAELKQLLGSNSQQPPAESPQPATATSGTVKLPAAQPNVPQAPTQGAAMPPQQMPPQMPPQATPQSPQGIAQLAPSVKLPPMPEKPTIEQIVQMQRALAPRDEYDAGVERLRKIETEREAFKKSLPDLTAEGIAAVEKSRAERLAIRSKQEGQDSYGRVYSFFRDLYTRGTSYNENERSILARDEANRQAELTESQLILKMKQAKQADQLGDFDRKATLEGEIAKLQDKFQGHRAQAAASAASIATHGYSGDVSLFNQLAQIASQERLKNAEIGMRKAELETNKTGQQLIAAQGRVDSAIKQLETIKEKNKAVLGMGAPDKDGKPKKLDPTMQAMYDNTIQEIERIQRDQLNPAIGLRDSLYEKVLGAPPSAQSQRPTGTPAPGTIMQGYRFKGGNPADSANWEKV